MRVIEDQQTNAVQTHLCLRYAFNPNSLTSIKETPSSPDCALPVDKQGLFPYITQFPLPSVPGCKENAARGWITEVLAQNPAVPEPFPEGSSFGSALKNGQVGGRGVQSPSPHICAL